MAVVKSPRGRAMAVGTRKQAARLAADLEAELALNDSLPDGWEAEADDALRILRERFPTMEDDDAYTAGPSSMSRGAKKNLGGIPESDEVRSEGRRRRKNPGGSGGQGAPASSRAGRRGRPARRSRSRSALAGAFAQTGIPGAGKSSARFALETLGLMIGLALLFLVLTDSERAAKGRSVVEMITGGITTAVQLIIAPIDPLAPKTDTAATRSTGSQNTVTSAGADAANAAASRLGAVTGRTGAAAQANSAAAAVREAGRLTPQSPLRLP